MDRKLILVPVALLAATLANASARGRPVEGANVFEPLTPAAYAQRIHALARFRDTGIVTRAVIDTRVAVIRPVA